MKSKYTVNREADLNEVTLHHARVCCHQYENNNMGIIQNTYCIMAIDGKKRMTNSTN